MLRSSVAGSGIMVTVNVPECVLVMEPFAAIVAWTEAGVTGSWVVNDPCQVLAPVESDTFPFASKATAVLPPARSVRRNGDVADTTQLCPTIKVAQAVPSVGEAGPRPSSSKLRAGAPSHTMKPGTGTGGPLSVRSRMFPVAPGKSGPPGRLVITSVPAPELIQPVPATVPSGDHTMVVADTVTPPPEQLAMLRGPIGPAIATFARLKHMTAAKTTSGTRKLDALTFIQSSDDE
jgi:hypothetical protein